MTLYENVFDTLGLSPEDGFPIVEAARSIRQFFAYECLRQISSWPKPGLVNRIMA